MNSHSFMVLARLVVVSLAIGGCQGQQRTDPAELLIPDDAKGVTVAPGSNDKTYQKSFFRSVTFPELAISNSALERLKSDGWKKCTSTLDSWMDYVDRSSGESIKVYRRVQHWSRDSDILEILFTYRVQLNDGNDAPPSNQRVTLNFQRFRSGSEVRAAMEPIKVDCK